MIRCLSILGTLLLLAGCSDGLSPAEREFAQNYRNAHASGEVEQVLKLHYLAGMSDQDQFLLRVAIEQELRYPIAEIRFAPLDPGDDFRYSFEGQEWGPNLPPEQRMVIAFDNPEHLHASYLLGLHEGKLYFINSAPLLDAKQ